LHEEGPLSILILGMGSGTYDHQCRAYFKDIDLEGVEIDEKITDLAHQYFDLPADAKVTTYDGRAYLSAVDRKYDVIMVDAYQDITIPFQMSSVEFFTLLEQHLKPGGVLVVKQYLKTLFPDATGQELYEKAYALIMSTAGHAGVFVRQQGAGIMNLEKATTATAYLTDAQGKRPKLELGENETGTFQLSFRVNNIGKTDKTYNIDFKAITEKTSQFNYQGFNQMGKTPEFAKKTNRYPWLHQDEVITVLTGTVWDVTDQCTMDGEKTVTVKAGETATVTLTLKANDSLMEHFRTNCPAGMY